MRIKYSKELLDNYCQENNVKLIKDYSNEKIWCEMLLEGKCTNIDCVNTFRKLFKNLIKNGSLCSQCGRCKKRKCISYNLKLLQSYCYEKNITLDKDYSKEKLGIHTIINGICEVDECKNNFDCKFKSLIRFGHYVLNVFIKKEMILQKNQIRKNMELSLFHKLKNLEKRQMKQC